MPSQNRNWGQASLNLLSFEVDIWGRLRRATEAARANLLSAEENRKAVVTTLVSDVATTYFTLRELDYELEISQSERWRTRQESLQLIQTRQGGGVATLLDLRQGEQLVYTAAETIPTLQQQIEQTENQITLLLGGIRLELSGDGPDRTGTSAGSARRSSFRAARTASRYSRGGTEPDRGEREDRRGQGGVLSANQPERISGRPEHAALKSV